MLQLSCRGGCQWHDVWAPLFCSHNGICILPKFLRRHKGRIIPNVTVTTRIRPSTYHALYKTLKKKTNQHEHTLNPFWFSSHSAILFDCCSYRTIFGLLTLQTSTKGEMGATSKLCRLLNIQPLKHGTALTQIRHIFIVTRQNITLPLRSVSGTERQSDTLHNLI